MIDEKFIRFMNHVLEENKKINLTSIVNEDEFIVKHFEDSLLPLKVYDFSNQKVADLGTGAGFPGIPLALKNKDTKFILIEPTLKRCNFLLKAKEDLNLDNVEVINSRMEDLSKEYKFDTIVTRAVAPLNILLELAIPYLKVNGVFIAYKGIRAEEEIKEVEKALKELNSSIFKIQKDFLSDGSERVNIFIKKEKETSSIYPRKYSVIKKHPL